MYDSVLTPELRCALVESEIPTGRMPPPRRQATITPDGLSIAAGAVWARFKDGRYLIARILVPPPAPSVEGRKGIERVTFAEPKGERSATFAGWLVRRNVDTYVVRDAEGRDDPGTHRGIPGPRCHAARVDRGCAAPHGRRHHRPTSVEARPRRRPPTQSIWSKWRISPGTAIRRNDINSPLTHSR